MRSITNSHIIPHKPDGVNLKKKQLCIFPANFTHFNTFNTAKAEQNNIIDFIISGGFKFMYSILLSLSLICNGIIYQFLLLLLNISVSFFFRLNLPLTSKFLCKLSFVSQKYSILCKSIEENLLKIM